MKNKIKILTAFFLLIILVFFYNLFTYKEFVSNLLFDKKLLEEQYSNYALEYFDFQPKNVDDVKNMIEWTERTSGFKTFKTINLKNIRVTYDSISDESTVFYSNEGEKNILLSKFTFFEYFINENNILLNTFTKPIFNCSELSSKEKISNEVILSQFELFNKEESILGNKHSFNVFCKQLNKIEKKINHKISKPRRLNILWFTYKKGKIKVICLDNFSNNKIYGITLKLEEYFSKIDTKYFDYSLFALRLFSPDGASISRNR